MKLRTGFVSNSSSSSFIVIKKKEDRLALKLSESAWYDLESFGEIDDAERDYSHGICSRRYNWVPETLESCYNEVKNIIPSYISELKCVDLERIQSEYVTYYVDTCYAYHVRYDNSMFESIGNDRSKIMDILRKYHTAKYDYYEDVMELCQELFEEYYNDVIVENEDTLTSWMTRYTIYQNYNDYDKMMRDTFMNKDGFLMRKIIDCANKHKKFYKKNPIKYDTNKYEMNSDPKDIASDWYLFYSDTFDILKDIIKIFHDYVYCYYTGSVYRIFRLRRDGSTEFQNDTEMYRFYLDNMHNKGVANFYHIESIEE